MTDAAITWTDERVELLKKLWSDGLSASQIAAELGDGVTRNAVIGKVHRLGLSGRGKAKAASAPRPRKATRAPSAPSPISPATRGNIVLAPIPRAAVGRAIGCGSRRRGGRRAAVRARDDHGIAGIHVPLAHGRPDETGFSVLRRTLGGRPSLLRPSRAGCVSARQRPQAGPPLCAGLRQRRLGAGDVPALLI